MTNENKQNQPTSIETFADLHDELNKHGIDSDPIFTEASQQYRERHPGQEVGRDHLSLAHEIANAAVVATQMDAARKLLAKRSRPERVEPQINVVATPPSTESFEVNKDTHPEEIAAWNRKRFRQS